MSCRRIILIIVSIAAGVVAALLVPKPLPELSREDLIAEVRSGNVHTVVIVDKEVMTAASPTRGKFRVVLQKDNDHLIEQLSAMGVEVKHESTADLIPLFVMQRP